MVCVCVEEEGSGRGERWWRREEVGGGGSGPVRGFVGVEGRREGSKGIPKEEEGKQHHPQWANGRAAPRNRRSGEKHHDPKEEENGSTILWSFET